MAQRTVTSYFSVLSGIEISGREAGIRFGLDGADYEIDLSSEEQQGLRDALAPFVSAARPVDAARKTRRQLDPTSIPDLGPSAKELRAWATENGFDVPTRGRVPEVVREAYRAAHLR